MAVDEALLNSLVHKYLASVSEKLAAKFQKEFSVCTEPGETLTLQQKICKQKSWNILKHNMFNVYFLFYF